MMLANPEDQKLLREIERWEASRFKTGIASAALAVVFRPVDRLVNAMLPDMIMEKIVDPMRRVLEAIQNTSQKFVNVADIVKKANKAGVQVKNFREFRKMPTPYLDALAKSFFNRSVIETTLQGAALGTGGYAMMLLDIPMLWMVNFKMVLQIGTCYGFDPASPKEREFALRIFCMASADSEKERRKDLHEMDKMIMNFQKRGVLVGRLRKAAIRETIQVIINRELRSFAKHRAPRGVPVIGTALGGAFSYVFTKEIATYAYMLYRKRLIQERLSALRGKQ